MTSEPQPSVRDWAWLLALLPAFPLVLLALRLWYLGRQDVPTMLLLVQNASPLGPISALMITVIWVFPVVVLVGAALGSLLRASWDGAMQSRLGRASARTPDWVIVLAVLVAAFSWQLRFLPALVMLMLMILGLEVRMRHGHRTWLLVGVALPVCVAVVEYTWSGPAIAAAIRASEASTAALLLIPPAATLALTGPIPAPAARPVTSGTAMAAGLLLPLLVAAVFLRTPVLPLAALEFDGGARPGGRPEVVRGYVIGVDDTMTTVLDEQGLVLFIPNQQVRSRTLCPDLARVPGSVVAVHDWPVEETVLEWVVPHRQQVSIDQRCLGRPLVAR